MNGVTKREILFIGTVFGIKNFHNPSTNCKYFESIVR